MSKIITAFVLVYVIAVAVFLGKVQDVTTVSITNKSVSNTHRNHNEVLSSRNTKMMLGDGYHHLLIFLQISDIHLSKFHDPSRITAFREFCDVTINIVQPAVVLASGDLTDGKYEDEVRTNEFKEEWIHYSKTLEDFGVLNKTVWLDMRGNHDNFNLHKNSLGFYSKYSIQAQRHNGSYMHIIVPYSERKKKSPSEKYSFIGIDAALNPGPKAPWNFYGKVGQEEFMKLEEFEKVSRESNGSIWFGHYPTSFIVTQSGYHIRELMSHASAYLCGHLHTAYGLVQQMYTIHRSGLLELELGDFKSNRRFRLAAFDHGVFTFADLVHNAWPATLITNPKHILFNNPIDLDVARKSTHIRILIFSPAKIQSVMIKIDDGNWNEGTHIDGPLYVLKWNPNKYFEGMHTITVSAWDIEGRKSSVTNPFAFDDSSMSFSFLGRLALMINAASLPYHVYLWASILAVFPLVVLRLLHKLVKNNAVSLRSITHGLGAYGTCLLRTFYVTATVNKLFIPLVFSPLYWPLGLWCFDELVSGSKGVAFAWGTFVEGTLLPAAFSYVLEGCIQLFWFHIPFMIVLCVCVDRRFRMICWKENLSPWGNNAPLFVLWVTQIIVACTIATDTGQHILFLGYLRNYSAAYGIILWFFSAKLKRSHFREAESVWKAPCNRDPTYPRLADQLNTGGNENDDHDS